jgi:serine/threonine protein kinase
VRRVEDVVSVQDEIEKWEIASHEIELGEKLGSGSFGEVYKGKLRGVEVAVKKLSLKQLDERKINQFKREVAIMRFHNRLQLISYLFFLVSNLSKKKEKERKFLTRTMRLLLLPFAVNFAIRTYCCLWERVVNPVI